MNYRELGAVAKIDRTVATDEECKQLPYVGLEHIEKETGWLVDGHSVEPEELLATKFRFSSDHVLYGKLRPYLKKVALPTFDGVCTTEILPILPDPQYLDKWYLWGLLLHPTFVQWATHIVTGANLPRLSPSDLARYEIPLPSLAEQRRIAAILRAADDERRRRRYTQTLSDGLLGEVFVRMFGEPATNPMGWEVCTIDQVLSGTQYGTSEKSNQEGRGYPILGMGNITYDGRVDLSSLAYVEMSRSEFQKLRLKSGDVIFNRTNSTELVGKTAYWRHEMDAVLASYLVKLTLLPTAVPEYFVAALNTPYFKGQFRERCKKAIGQSNISPTLLSEFSIAVPPPDLQREFAAIAQAHELMRRQQEESARQSDHLFDTLLHRAFAGEV